MKLFNISSYFTYYSYFSELHDLLNDNFNINSKYLLSGKMIVQLYVEFLFVINNKDNQTK